MEVVLPSLAGEFEDQGAVQGFGAAVVLEPEFDGAVCSGDGGGVGADQAAGERAGLGLREPPSVIQGCNVSDGLEM